MRILLAVSSVLSLSACFGAGEPLTTTTAQQSIAHATPSQQALADVVNKTQFASQQAHLSAQAGLSHDVVAAHSAALALADAAAVLQQRALDVEIGNGVTQEDVDNAVTVAALAASSAAEIDSDLNPPTESVCSQQCGCEGCSDVCTDEPGTVDESVLSQDVQDANDAAAGCADASDNLNAALG